METTTDKELVSFELSNRLKMLGYTKPCTHFWENGKLKSSPKRTNHNQYISRCSAPTLEDAGRFLAKNDCQDKSKGIFVTNGFKIMHQPTFFRGADFRAVYDSTKPYKVSTKQNGKTVQVVYCKDIEQVLMNIPLATDSLAKQISLFFSHLN